MNTYVNGYIVSTVGEYVPDSGVRRIYRESRGMSGNELRGDAEEHDFIKQTADKDFKGYGEEIGVGRKYETMVFPARKSDKKCCPYEMSSFSEIDSNGYNTAEDAYKGHMKFVKKYTHLKPKKK